MVILRRAPQVRYETDAAQLNPVFVIIAGLMAAALFVALLIVVVKLVVP